MTEAIFMSVIDLLPILITLFGFCFLVKLRFFYIAHPIKYIKSVGKNMRSQESRRALILALAGTLGVGNIVGVAHGIAVGGAGCVFWIFMSGFFSAVIKYAECTLAADMGGNMAEVLRKSFHKFGGMAAGIYAALTVLLSLTMGSALQANALVGVASFAFSPPPMLVALLFFVLVLALISTGVKRIESATAIIIPMAAICYLLISTLIILTNVKALPSVLARILSEAFNFKSIYGGVSTFLVIKGIKEGFARGLLSNEAGAGTSATAQARALQSDPTSVGLCGALEVFCDTTVLCSMTGICVLLVNPEPQGSGVSIILSTLGSILGRFSGVVAFLLILAFVYSTVLCWYYYGSVFSAYLFGERCKYLFTSVFLLSTLVGASFSEDILILISDYILFFMSLLTLLALKKSSKRIVFLSEQFGIIKKSKKSDNGEGENALVGKK